MPTATPAHTRAQHRFERAVRRHLAGDRINAIAMYRDVLALEPDHCEALNNMAAALCEVGREDEALAAFERGAQLNPDYANSHHNLGVMLARKRRHAEAAVAFERAIRLDGTNAVWFNDLGNAYQAMLLNERALVAYERAIALAPRMHEAMNNRGVVLRGMLKREDAIVALRAALDIEPTYLPALNNLGIVLKECRRFDDAIATFERALDIVPETASVLANLSALYQELGQLDKAFPLAERAVRAGPTLVDAYNALGNCYYESARFDEALVCYEKARALDPHDPNAAYNLSLQLLGAGDLARGWPLFESRLRLQILGFDLRHLDTPLWDGSPLNGRTILIHSEQGLGDSIQFVRYANMLRARGAGRVVMECIPAATSLLATAPGIDEIVTRGAPTPKHDVRTYLLSLPGLFGTTLDEVPADVPYLRADPRPAALQVSDEPGVLKVGLCWAGNPVHQRDKLRSIPLDLLRPLFDVPNVRFYSLQKGGPERDLASLPNDVVVDLAPHLNDFRDTAAVMSQLDVVISVDTSVAHLAGALGRPTWLLLPCVADFRWMRDRTDSPWYPTMRLFRQHEPMAWGPVIDDVRATLAAEARDEARRLARPTTTAIATNQPLTSLTSVTRRSDGRPRFELVIGLTRLATQEAFHEYQSELVGTDGGHERVVRDALDDLLSAGDTLIDVAPGLGITALSAATTPARSVTVHAVEPDTRHATELEQQALSNGLSERMRTFATIEAALAPIAKEIPERERGEADAAAEGRRVGNGSHRGRVVARIGDATRANDVLDAMTPIIDARHLSGVIFPSVVAEHASDALDRLDRAGYVHFAATKPNGEVSLDPLTDRTVEQTVISLAAWRLAELATDVIPSEAAQPRSRGTSVLGREEAYLPSTEVPRLASLARNDRTSGELAIDWPIGSDSGWGVYGLNLAMHLAKRNAPRPMLLAQPASLPPLAQRVLHASLESSAERVRSHAAELRIDGPLLQALGNNATHTPLAPRFRASATVGVIFFEDTHVEPKAMAHFRSLDRIIAGSTWNAEVLRGMGLSNVRVALQGIDPTVFHPAPRSGHLADRFVVFSGGKLELRKGQDIVVAAFRAFRERHPDALLMTAWHNHWPHLIGDLSLSGHVRGTPAVAPNGLRITEWLVANGIPADAVLDLGAVPNAFMGQLVREADVALFTNRCEGGTNLVAMECMASGVPTILSANTGHLDLVRLGGCIPLGAQTPFTKPTRFFRATDGWGESNVEEAVEALERVYADRAAAREIAREGAERMTDLTWERQVERLLTELEPLF